METNRYTFKNASIIIFTFSILLLLLFLSACKKNNDEKLGSFALKGNPSNLIASPEGISQTYVIFSNGAWKIELLTKEKWVSIEPMEGNGNGTFTLNVRENTTMQDRSLILIFIVNDKRPNISLKIEQNGRAEADVEETAFLTVDDEPVLEATATGITGEYTIRSNGVWKIEIPSGEEWVSVSSAEGTSDGMFSITVARNLEYEPRTMDLTFSLNGVFQPKKFTVNQEQASETGKVIFHEDFSWLTYGNSIFYENGDEKRIDSWTIEEVDKRWTSTVNTVDKSGNQALVYARQGFVKLGKTSYGGDFISPKLSEVKGIKNLLVKFKAVPYQTKGGARDDNKLKVNIIGPGTISIGEFIIDNWPNYDLDPNSTEAWKASEAERTFTIIGATSETQIRFLGGAFDLLPPVSPNKNRIFIDDVNVTVKD